MCGIAGSVNWGNEEFVQRMVAVQRHRGPDDSGVWEHVLPDGTSIGLGSSRLAIIDLSPAGHMPMSNGSGKVWITYNGEVYNFTALRDELKAKGHIFKSNTDTEVVLHLYEQEGPECVRRLNGMFAFAICDLRENKPLLFLARDHFGIKPLYYSHRARRFAFASEVKALLQLPGLVAELDEEALDQFLTFLWIPDPSTMFRGVCKLPPGHYALFRDGELTIQRYWDLRFPKRDAEYPLGEAELVEQIRSRLQDSVRRQMISDVPLGAFLSAGMDSTSIVAMMAGLGAQPVKTYTVTFPLKYRVGEITLDDPDVARRVAQHFGCEHHQIVVEPEVAELLPNLVWHMDEPTADPAIVACYLLCREARRTVTVLLSGIGGDEIFGGYRRHYAHHWSRWYRLLPAPIRKKLAAAVMSIPSMRGTSFKGAVRLAKKMARSGDLKPVEAFLMNSSSLDQEIKAQLYAPELRLQLNGKDPWRWHLRHLQEVAEADFLNQVLYLDTKCYMPSLNLTYNDKMSMASSVEARVPFLDRELVEFVAANVPPSLKIKGSLRPTTKYIFREAMASVLPPEVLAQPKAGFGAPVDYWLAHDLQPMVEDLLGETQLRRRGLFNPGVVRRLVDEHRSGQQDWSEQIWQLLTLELWLRAFVDSPAPRKTVDLAATV